MYRLARSQGRVEINTAGRRADIDIKLSPPIRVESRRRHETRESLASGFEISRIWNSITSIDRVSSVNDRCELADTVFAREKNRPTPRSLPLSALIRLLHPRSLFRSAIIAPKFTRALYISYRSDLSCRLRWVNTRRIKGSGRLKRRYVPRGTRSSIGGNKYVKDALRSKSVYTRALRVCIR